MNVSAAEELIRAIAELHALFPDWRMGQLVANLVTASGGKDVGAIWDVEDEQLLEVARSSNPGMEWFERYVGKLVHKSTIQPKRPGEFYRCPCCHDRTLEERGGFPASVKGTGDGNDPGLLRIDYPGFSGEEKLQKISWEEFFAKFDSENLAFLYQDEPDSRFSKLIDRTSVNAKAA